MTSMYILVMCSGHNEKVTPSIRYILHVRVHAHQVHGLENYGTNIHSRYHLLCTQYINIHT